MQLSNINMLRCTLEHNYATQDGGAIHIAAVESTPSLVQMEECQLLANGAMFSGGGIFGGGHKRVGECAFANNHAEQGNGSAIYHATSEASLVTFRIALEGNIASNQRNDIVSPTANLFMVASHSEAAISYGTRLDVPTIICVGCCSWLHM